MYVYVLFNQPQEAQEQQKKTSTQVFAANQNPRDLQILGLDL